MSERFDPYYTWLGIPPGEQPANHYRLLGISQFESNEEVISNAADRLMLHLRAFQAGKRSKESQQLLNEISAARVCLLSPAKKAAYDDNLRAASEISTAALPEAMLPPGAGDATLPVGQPLPPYIAVSTRGARRTGGKSKSASSAGLWLALGSIAVLVLAAAIALFVVKGKPAQPVGQSRPGNNAAPSASPSPGSSDAVPHPPAPLVPSTPGTASKSASPPEPTPQPDSTPSAVASITPPPTAVPSPTTPIETKPPEVPQPGATSAAAIANAATEVQAKYAAQLAAAKRPDQKIALARTLKEEADKASSEPARQAALLLEAQRMAAAGGDLRMAIGILRDRASRYQADLLAEAADMLKAAVFPAAQRAENVALADLASQFLDQAIAENRFDAAEALRKAASQAYGKLKIVDQVNRFNAMQADLAATKAEHDKLTPAFEKLAAMPTDPEANLVVGRYLCFYKNDWYAGLPKLALSSDSELANAARKDAENSKTAAASAELGELWWDIGQKLPPTAKRNVNRRAAESFLTAIPGLTGNQRTGAVRRVEQALPSRGDQATTLVKEGLLAYWSFDEGNGRLAQDATKSRNHALLIGAGWTKGILGNAMETRAVNEYARFLGGANLNQWSISLWVKIDRVQGNGGLLMTAGNEPGRVHVYVGGAFSVHAHVVNSGGAASKVRIEPNRWHHIVVRYVRTDKDANGEIWIDGQPASKFGGNKDIVPAIGPGRIGGWWEDDGNQALLGAIDEVRLYGRPLTDQEIATLHTVGQTGQ